MMAPGHARPALLAITGGIGSGKSAALDAFRRLGAAVLSADAVVHEAYADPDVAQLVAKRFGRDVVTSTGGIDRRRLGDMVFSNVDALRALEAIIHPRVALARERWVDRERAAVPPPPLLVCEVPLLFEVGADRGVDVTLVVTASDAVRRTRVEARGQSFAARSGRQMAEADKVARADHAFVNDGSLDALEAWVGERFRQYASLDVAP